MSTDANYILCYEDLGYGTEDTVDKDIERLKYEFGGEFLKFGSDVFWVKPKYTLHPEIFKKLNAIQILERKDCELWKIVK